MIFMDKYKGVGLAMKKKKTIGRSWYEKCAT
jgi:hypothetical protein